MFFESSSELDANMHCDEQDAPSLKNNIAKCETESLAPSADNQSGGKKHEKKCPDVDDPKPRIVITFRSEKPGAKSSNMKIVSTEEKHDDASPRRSSRTRSTKWDSDDDNETLGFLKDKSISRSISENDEGSDSSHIALKRSTRRRRREFPDNVLANAIARKVKSYNEAASTQRLSRRIKPAPKVLASKELQIGVETQNNATLGLVDNAHEEGVETRRSSHRKNFESQVVEQLKMSERKMTKRSHEDVDDNEVKLINDSPQNTDNVKKLKHLCGLGLKAISPGVEDEVASEDEDRETEGEDIEQDIVDDDDEGDDESEVISRLIEADANVISEDSDEEFFYPTEVTRKGRQTRKSLRFHSSFTNESEKHSSPVVCDGEDKSQRRRSSRKSRVLESYTPEYDTSSRRRSPRKSRTLESYTPEYDTTPADGDAGSEATSSDEESGGAVAQCFCEAPSNVYAAPDDLPEPVFCQAIDSVEGMRVGCSLVARREADGARAALLRAGPRAPFLLLCELHALRLRNHMCCPNCGLFCTEGTFSRCSLGHLFHTECALKMEKRLQAGCLHCGVVAWDPPDGGWRVWVPAGAECARVRLAMRAARAPVYLPDQRVHCTPAHLGFSKLPVPVSADAGAPLVPPELLPSPPVDVTRLCGARRASGDAPLAPDALCDAILAGETAEQLIPKIVSGIDLNKPLQRCDGGTCVHAAARSGALAALYLLHYAGANLDAVDSNSRTPLMLAVLALLDKSLDKHDERKKDKDIEEMEIDESKDDDMVTDGDKKADEGGTSGSGCGPPRDEDLMKVIRYLVAADCDVNIPGPDGMTALHMAAQHGGAAVCGELLRAPGAARDPRDDGGWTPLAWAADYKHTDVVRLLLAEGADAGSVDNKDNAVVHWSALAGDAATIPLLLHAAPHALHAANAHTETPLHIAAREGHYACVVTLLAHGARTDIENSFGELPVETCSGRCQTVISLNMQMSIAAQEKRPACRLLSSDISNGREAHPLPCVNEVDAEPAPAFTYVTRHVLPQPLGVDCTLDTLQGCLCAEECGAAEGSACACVALGVRRWWVRGRLARDFPYHDPPMLFECNHTCACNLKKCGNHVVSRLLARGSLGARAQVFRTERGARGWGLRAAARVPRGAPVAVYCGELLPAARADARADDQYVFELDVKPDLLEQCADRGQLCVDAARYGSAARFVNHSCRPNLAPVRVFTHTRDLRLPTVTLFATTDIAAGDEFTFDYGDNFWSVMSKLMKCECGTPECRYPTKTEEKDS